MQRLYPENISAMSRISIIFARALVAIAFSAMLVSSAPGMVPISTSYYFYLPELQSPSTTTAPL